jgi:hypothetical protein
MLRRSGYEVGMRDKFVGSRVIADAILERNFVDVIGVDDNQRVFFGKVWDSGSTCWRG